MNQPTSQGRRYSELDHVQERLIDIGTNPRDRAYASILGKTGMRISEAIQLKITDIDFQKGTITIVHLKEHLKLKCRNCGELLGKRHLFCPGCRNKVDQATREKIEQRRQRVLPIDGDTLKILKEYVRRGGPVAKDGKTLVFGINRHRAWQIVKECAEKVRLPKLVNPETGRVHNVSPHKLRDAFAVMAVKQNDSGDGLRMLQEHLGHASFNTTAKYRKVSGKEHHDWYQKLWQKKGS